MSAIRIPKDGTRVTGNTIVGEHFRGIAQQGVINAQILCDGLEWEKVTLLPKEIELLHIDQPRKQP